MAKVGQKLLNISLSQRQNVGSAGWNQAVHQNLLNPPFLNKGWGFYRKIGSDKNVLGENHRASRRSRGFVKIKRSATETKEVGTGERWYYTHLRNGGEQKRSCGRVYQSFLDISELGYNQRRACQIDPDWPRLTQIGPDIKFGFRKVSVQRAWSIGSG